MLVLVSTRRERYVDMLLAKGLFPLTTSNTRAGALGEDTSPPVRRNSLPRHNDGRAPAELAFERGSRVVDTGIFEFFATFGVEPAILGAGRDHHRLGMQALRSSLRFAGWRGIRRPRGG